jgi:hypothetical protein
LKESAGYDNLHRKGEDKADKGSCQKLCKMKGFFSKQVQDHSLSLGADWNKYMFKQEFSVNL